MLAGHPPALWLIFAALVAMLLTVDLAVIGRLATLSIHRAAWWSAAVVAAAALFCAVVAAFGGRGDAVQFATGYVMEFSLSVDNLLVFMIVLHYFAVPAPLQSVVLKWGILGAIVMRGVVIGAGTLALRQFQWVIYLFGALLIVTAIRMIAKPEEGELALERNPMLRAVRRFLPVSEHFAGDAFMIRLDGRRLVTPLLLVVLVIEWTDLVFAADSIPAVFAITRDPFLIYTSNVLAVIGLRALFFVLSAMLARFAYLRFGVATVLALVGIKMLLSQRVAVPSLASLVVIVTVLAASVLASLVGPRRPGPAA